MDGAVGSGTEGREVIQELCAEVKGVKEPGVEVEAQGSQGRILEERIRVWEQGSTGKAVIQRARDGENSISKPDFACLRLFSVSFLAPHLTCFVHQSSSLVPTSRKLRNNTPPSSHQPPPISSSPMKSPTKALSSTSTPHPHLKTVKSLQSTIHHPCHQRNSSKHSRGTRWTG